MSSFTSWPDDVFFRQCAESNFLMLLSMVTVCSQEKAGYMERSMRFIPTYKVSTDNVGTTDVVVYGIVRWRLLGRVPGRRLSTWNGRCA